MEFLNKIEISGPRIQSVCFTVFELGLKMCIYDSFPGDALAALRTTELVIFQNSLAQKTK